MTDGVQALPAFEVEVATHGDSPGGAPPRRRARESEVATGVAPSRIVRRKSFTMAPYSVDVAIAEMELLGGDFHLFREVGSDAAAIVYRGGPTGYRLALVAPILAAEVAAFERPVTVSPHPLPCLTEDKALQRLVLLDRPFLFFIEASQGRAGVLYRRVEGGYGLIAPAV